MLLEPKSLRNTNTVSGFSFNLSEYKSQKALQEDLIGKVSKKMLFLNQQHTDKIALHPGSDLKSPFDAIITQRKGYYLFLKTADCNPVMFFDSKTNVIGAIHAGWRGIHQEIITKTINIAQKKYQLNLDSTKFIVGPSIRSCCYEVQSDLVEKFNDKFDDIEEFFVKRSGKIHFNQIEAISHEFNRIGVKKENVEIIDQCTCCSKEFFSYRENKTDMRNISFIGLK